MPMASPSCPFSSSHSKEPNLIEKERSWIPYDIGIMIIDEDPTSLFFVHTLLKTCHYRVTSYEDPAEALADLYKKNNDYDLVIADLHMITMSGLSFVQHIARKFKLPVITTCADEDPQLLQQALRCGSCFHLVKPITISNMEFVWKKSWEKKAKNPIHPTGLHNFGQSSMAMIHGQRGNSHGKHVVQIGQSSSANVDSKGNRKGDELKERAKDPSIWNDDLHKRFLVAVSLLGDDAVPTSIIGIMNVVGVTLKQVASHLQKHRRRVNQEKDAKPEILARIKSHRKSTRKRFPTCLIPTGSKKPIHTLDDNPETSIRKPTSIFPKPSSHMNIQTSSLQNHSAPELPPFFQKQRKQLNRSTGITILNSLNENLSMFNAPVFCNPFQSVVDCTEGNMDSEFMHNQVEAPVFDSGEEWQGLDEFLAFDGSLIDHQGIVDEEVGSSNDHAGLDRDFNYKELTFDDALLDEMIKNFSKEG